MAQGLGEFLKNKGITPLGQRDTSSTGTPSVPSTSIGVSDVVSGIPSATGKVLRWAGKQLMKPVGTVAKTAESVGQAIGRQKPSELTKIPGEAYKVLKGEEEYSFTQLWREYLPEYKTAGTVIGLVTDIAADPLNFVGGITTKGLGLVEKGLKKVPIIQKGLKPIFSAKVGVKEVDKIIDTYKSLGEYRKAKVIDAARDVQKQVSKLGKDEIIDVSNYIEKGVKSKNPAINKLGKEIQDTYKLFKSIEKQVGVKGGELTQYAPHIKAKETLGQRLKNFVFPSKKWSTKLGGAEKQRQILKFVADDGTELIGKAENLGLKTTKEGFKKGDKIFQPVQASIDEIAQAFGKHFFEENPAIQMAYRGMASAKAVTSKQFFNSIKKFATKTGVETTVPELKGLKFTDDIARQIDNYHKSIQPEELNVLFKTYDTVLNWWKGQALVAPSYHMRNFVSNIWNNFLAGVKSPIDYIQAGLLQSEKGKNLRIAGKTANEIIELAEKRGVLGKGWYAADIPTTVESGIKATWKQGINPLQQQNYAFKLNKAFGSTIENNARLAHFINKLKAGSTVDDAVLSVKKFLFDYQDLSAFEKTVLKRVFPFYTWTRKNIPLQLENLITQPGKYAGLEKVVRVIENVTMGDNRPANEKYLSDYIKNNTAMRVGYNKATDTYQYFLLGNWLPSYQAMDFLSQPLYNIMAMVTPIIKTPMEVLMNQSTFFKDTLGERDVIENYPGETTSYLGFMMPKKTATILRNIRLLNELDKLNPGKIFGGKQGEPSVFKGLPAIDIPGLGTISPAGYKYGKGSIQPTQTERGLGTLFGKLQQYKEDTSKYFYQADTQRRIEELQAAIRAASRKGDRKRVEELNKQLREFLQQRKK